MNNSTERAREMSEAFVWTHIIPNRTPVLIIVSAVFFSITTLFFIARATVRSMIRQWGWDDVMAALAYTILIVQTSFLLTAAHDGFGKHRVDIPLMFSTAMFWFWMYQIFYKIIGAFTKLTFCLLYLRLFPQRGFRKLNIAAITIISLGSLAFMLGTIFQCRPVARNWNRTLPGSCFNFNAFWYSHASFNTAMDILVFLMPIPMISSLHMNRRSRVGLASIFLLGAFTIIASIIRMTSLYGSANSQTDPTWGSTTALIWTEVEANTAVICCCLPALRQVAVNLWRRMIGKFGPETPSTRSANGQQSQPTPGNLKPFGTFADAHHSLNNSLDHPSSDVQSGTNLRPPSPSNRPAASRWGRMRWPGLKRSKDLSDINEEDSRRTEDGYASPPIELGRIHRRRDFNVESERVEPVEQPRGDVFGMSLEEFLAKGPGAAPPKR